MNVEGKVLEEFMRCPVLQKNNEYGKYRHNFGWNTLEMDYTCRHCGIHLIKGIKDFEKLTRKECEERHAYIADNISKKMVEDTTKDVIGKVEGMKPPYVVRADKRRLMTYNDLKEDILKIIGGKV